MAGVYRFVYYAICSLTGIYRNPQSFDSNLNCEFDHDYQFDDRLEGVQWEYHLSRAIASETIRNQLLTIHYFFA